MKTRRNRKPPVEQEERETLTIFVDGAGCGPDGQGSGFAWACQTTKEKAIERVPNLTNNQAEYRALVAALAALARGACVVVYSDSQLLVCQFNGLYKVKDPVLQTLLAEARSLIREKALQICVQWVPRSRNLAGKLL